MHSNICIQIPAIDGRWGSKEKDGTWNGMVGVKRKDIRLTPC